jgi:hypothetical protein
VRFPDVRRLSRKWSVSVRFLPLHTEHDPSSLSNLQHLRISSFVRRKIMIQLLSNVDEKQIVRLINQSLLEKLTLE